MNKEIIETITNLIEGQRLHVVCPFCNATHERSFVIGKYSGGRVFGKCYRAKCGQSYVFTKGEYVHTDNQPKKVPVFTPREFDRLEDCTKLPSCVVSKIYNDHKISEEQLQTEGVLWYPRKKSLVFPVYDKHGEQFGYMTKVFYKTESNKTAPKWITYFDRPTTRMHYPYGYSYCDKYKSIVIVEDILSAIRLSSFVRSVAILGTSLGDMQAVELSEHTDRLIIALDPDAIGKAYSMKKKYNSLFSGGIRVCILKDDPKDYKDDGLLISNLKEVAA